MIKKTKMALNMLKYAFGIKMNVGFMVLFSVFGILIEIMTQGSIFIGAFFIFLVSMWPVQMIFSISMSHEVASSPYKKDMQTVMPALVTLVSSGVAFTVIIIMKAYEYIRYPECRGGIVNGLLVIALFAIAIAIYIGIAYKFFIVSIILFVFVYAGTYIYLAKLMNPTIPAVVPFPVAIVLCYATVIFSALLQWGISCIFYKYPMSKRAQGAMMKKYL